MLSDPPARVLVADGEPVVRTQLFRALLDENIFSDCVSTTAEALQKLETDAYGVIVIDINLAGDVGGVVERIARMQPADRPVVLVLAANPERAHTLDVEIVQIVLRRPVLLRQLTDVIASCLRSVRARPEIVPPPRPSTDQPTS